MNGDYVKRRCRFCRTVRILARALSGTSVQCSECRQSSWFSLDSAAAVLSGREQFPQEHEQAVSR